MTRARLRSHLTAQVLEQPTGKGPDVSHPPRIHPSPLDRPESFLKGSTPPAPGLCRSKTSEGIA